MQNVTYSVPGSETSGVCRGPQTDQITWYNRTDHDTGLPLYIPEGIKTFAGARDCVSMPNGDPTQFVNGMYCASFGNPGAPMGDVSKGYRSFDNILFSWLMIFLHMTFTDWSFVM